MAPTKQSDEIDLIQLLLNGVNTIRNNFWMIVLCFAVGTCIGFFYYSTAKKVFINKMIVSSAILTNSYTSILFQNINRHLGEGDRGAVAKEFGTTEDVVKNLGSVKIESVRSDAANDANERDRFLITVEVYDQSTLPELQKGILHFLEENEFVKIRTEQNRNSATRLLKAIDKEIADIEDFKKRLMSGEYSQKSNGNMMFDPTSANTKIVELTEKKINLENSLELSNSVYVIEGFDRFKHQSKPRLLMSLVAGAFFGLVFVGIFIAFKSIRRLLRMAEPAN